MRAITRLVVEKANALAIRTSATVAPSATPRATAIPLRNYLHSKARFEAPQVLIQLFARVHAALVS